MIPPLPYLDRYRNEGTRSYSSHAAYSEAEPRFRPDSPEPTFHLPGFELSREEINLYTADPDPRILASYLTPEGIRFFVHPQLMNPDGADPYLRRVLSSGTPGVGVEVAPSSSTRTLYVQGGHPPHALKVHFPYRVSRYGRRMRDEVVVQAIDVSSELQAGVEAMDRRFSFLREVLGVTLRNHEPDAPRGENWGYLVREMTPFPPPEEERPLIPGFALYGKDLFHPSVPPLLFQLAGPRDPLEFVVEEIMLPVVRHWALCFLHFGFMLEPHGQNVLLEPAAPGKISRIVHRDLNLGIDIRRRRHLHLPEGGRSDYNRMSTGEFASITYDKFMGGHFFDRLVELLREEDPSLAPDDFREPCRREFSRIFPDHERYLPKTVHYFSETRDRFGKPHLRNMGVRPAWRP